MFILLIAAAVCCASLLGGYFALKMKDKLHLILGFSAGAVIGVAFFDLLPESIALCAGLIDAGHVLMYAGFGFLTYMILDRILLPHGHDHEHTHDTHRGHFGAATLSFHSMLDGLAIGLAIQVNPAIGAIVAAAVLAHDFSDGINTVSLALRNGGSRALAWKWLGIDSLAPVLGIIVGSQFILEPVVLSPLLAVLQDSSCMAAK